MTSCPPSPWWKLTDANGAENAERLDGKEVARIECDFDFEVTKSVSNLGVSAAEVLLRKPDDKLTNFVRLTRSARLLALLGAVIPGAGELTEPRQNRARSHNLATLLALFGCQRLSLDGQPAPLVISKRDSLLAGGGGVSFSKYTHLRHEIVDPTRHSL
ncbi:MAG TPA: hypothetical protein VIV60_36690, partial [Polyangiaceae bacterium]